MTLLVPALLTFNLLIALLIYAHLRRQKEGRSEALIKEMLSAQFKENRQELSEALRQNREELTRQLKDNREELSGSLKILTDTMALRQGELIKSTEAKLEKMRETVDEKLHKTLEERLGQSFKLVSENQSSYIYLCNLWFPDNGYLISLNIYCKNKF